jgi:hypothetical protein
MDDKTMNIGVDEVVLAPGGTGGIIGDEIGVITGEDVGI